MTTTIFRILSACKFLGFFVIAVAALVAGACDDHLDAPSVPGDVEEDLPAVIQLKIDVADRAQLSRADVPDTRITSLWIGIFSATTGDLKGRYVVSDAEIDNIEHQKKTITISDTRSGLMHIVGIANYEHRYVVHKNESGEIETLPMTEALAALSNYNDYLSLAATYTADGDVTVDQPINAMLMSGVYTEENHTDLASAPVETTVHVTPSTKASPYVAPGTIHLRRLISQNTFNVSYNAANIRSMDIVNWQVHNVPNSAWLRERYDDEIPLNAGEVITIDGVSVVDTHQFTAVSRSGNKASFSFWQLENRHTGLEPDETFNSSNYYDYRENEFKNSDGSNSGKYKSLLESVDDDSYRANATYVTFTADLEMLVDENGNSLADAGLKSRNVRAHFTVHLGYCENKSNEKLRAMDFNCRRNAKYTYNVTLNNVNSMVVEAESDAEERPSIEGTITDITDRYERIDAHYHLMNVTFTQSELDNFTFNIEAHDNNGVHYFTENNVPDPSDNANFRLYSWVEFRKTSDSAVLADYKPHSAGGDTYYLHEMKGKAAGVYTMFINEYAYERFDDNGNIYAADKTNWHWFCGAPDRRVWLNVQAETSADGQTLHHKSKYAVSQRSIQTYYSTAVDKALGVEHVNETLGANMRNNWNNAKANDYKNGIGYRGTSGRYIMGQFILSIGNKTKASSTTALSWPANNDSRPEWKTFIDFNAPFKTNAVTNVQKYSQDAATHTMPGYVNLYSSITTDTRDSYSSDKYDPDQSRSAVYVESMAACLNRNRDNDGDGKIDGNEVRWFIPSEMQLTRVILGRQALATPLMNYAAAQSLPYVNNKENSRYLVANANGQQLWAMEGLSTSCWKGNYRDGGRPWNVRCVRYVGSDIGPFSINSSVPPPYELDNTSDRTVVLDRINRLAVRSYVYSGDNDEVWPPHLVTDQNYNRCAYKFEYADSYFTLNNLGDISSQSWAEYLSKNNPCSRLNTDTKKGWRVPNQKELVIVNSIDSNLSNGGKIFVSSSFEFFREKDDPPALDATDVNMLKNRAAMIYFSGENRYSRAVITVPNAGYAVRCVRDIE